MTTTTHKPVTCKNPECKIKFTPQINYAGLVVSGYCPECRMKREFAKRREQADKRNVREPISDKNALKSKIEVVRKSLTTEKASVLKKRTTEKSIKRELDRVFSLFIRQRDADQNGNIICISSEVIIPWKKSDCGHYINRKHMATRWDEINCNAQSRSDNRFDEGNMSGYRQGLIKKYGEPVVEMLELKKFNTSNIGKAEMLLLIELYKAKNKAFKNS